MNDSKASQNDVVLYSTFFYFPFKLRTNVEIDGAVERKISGLGQWQEQVFDLWQSDRDDDLKKQNQALIYFHKYLREIAFNIKGKKSGFLSYYSLRDKGKEVFSKHDREKVIYVNGAVTGFYLFHAALYMFKDSKIGILSLGVKNDGCSLKEALEFSMCFRVLYLSDSAQISDWRERKDARIYESIKIENTPLRNKFTNKEHFVIDRETYLPHKITFIVDYLLPFHYRDEFIPLLDDRMVLHTLICLNNGLKSDYGFENAHSEIGEKQAAREAYRQLFSRILFVDKWGEGYAYDHEFMSEFIKKHLYIRWQHYGTLHGFCHYADAVVQFGDYPLIINNFSTVYYMMSILALYYRCALIDFADRSSEVTKTLIADTRWRDKENQVKELRKDFLRFSNVWYFRELTNQDQGIEMFDMHRKAYELDELYGGVKEEIERLNEFVEMEESKKETKAVNWLSFLGIPLAILAVVTGFFGMNFEGIFHTCIQDYPVLSFLSAIVISFAVMFIVKIIYNKKLGGSRLD
jgi:hypothetical protein